MTKLRLFILWGLMVCQMDSAPAAFSATASAPLPTVGSVGRCDLLFTRADGLSGHLASGSTAVLPDDQSQDLGARAIDQLIAMTKAATISTQRPTAQINIDGRTWVAIGSSQSVGPDKFTRMDLMELIDGTLAPQDFVEHQMNGRDSAFPPSKLKWHQMGNQVYLTAQGLRSVITYHFSQGRLRWVGSMPQPWSLNRSDADLLPLLAPMPHHLQAAE